MALIVRMVYRWKVKSVWLFTHIHIKSFFFKVESGSKWATEPHWLPAKNRILRLQIARAQQNWTIGDWKMAPWSDESQFLLQHSDGRIRIWCKQHKSMDPSCFVSTDQASSGVMVWGVFSWHILGPSVPIEHCWNTTAYRSIVVDHVHRFMTAVWLLPAG